MFLLPVTTEVPRHDRSIAEGALFLMFTKDKQQKIMFYMVKYIEHSWC